MTQPGLQFPPAEQNQPPSTPQGMGWVAAISCEVETLGSQIWQGSWGLTGPGGKKLAKVLPGPATKQPGSQLSPLQTAPPSPQTALVAMRQALASSEHAWQKSSGL